MNEEKRHVTNSVPVRMWALAAVLAVLAFVSVLQSIELAALQGRLGEINTELAALKVAPQQSETKVSVGVQSNISSKPSNTLQRNLQNLPGMVGGC
jgi:hypothetical protein